MPTRPWGALPRGTRRRLCHLKTSFLHARANDFGGTCAWGTKRDGEGGPQAGAPRDVRRPHPAGDAVSGRRGRGGATLPTPWWAMPGAHEIGQAVPGWGAERDG